MADIAPAPANVVPEEDAAVGSGVAKELIVQAQAVRIADDGEIELCDKSNLAKYDCDGLAVCRAEAGQVVTFIRRGNLALGAVLTSGTTYVVSTGGGVSPDADVTATGHYKNVVGVATSSTNLWVETINPPGGAQVP